jgi:hypothetical protein
VVNQDADMLKNHINEEKQREDIRILTFS